MRKEFVLPSEDREFLDEQFPGKWETVIESKTQWLIIHDYSIPIGYDHKVVTVALLIPPLYSDVQIDMVYFSPAISLQNGNTIRQLRNETIDGKVFQRWSRHRTSTNAWRPGIDNVEGHLVLVQSWLERELK